MCVHSNAERRSSGMTDVRAASVYTLKKKKGVYLLGCLTINHVRHERDLPVQEGGRSQVQWNLVCHHHCDVHSWRNWLNFLTWKSTEMRGCHYSALFHALCICCKCQEQNSSELKRENLMLILNNLNFWNFRSTFWNSLSDIFSSSERSLHLVSWLGKDGSWCHHRNLRNPLSFPVSKCITMAH